MGRQGIDVSKYQGIIDWKTVKESGIEFAILRAGYGMSSVDTYFTRNIEECIKVGMPVGVYWFIYGTNEEDAIKNADKCHKTISQYKDKITMKVWCDFEYDTERYANEKGVVFNKKTRTDVVIAFCERMKGYGYDIGVYANPDYMNSKFNDLSQYPLWIAWYGGTESNVRKKFNPMMWQQSSKGSVNGINGNVDMNLWYGEINVNPAPKTSIRNNILNICNQNLGVGEPTGEDKFIDWFNKNVLKTWSFAMNVAWCSIFVTYAGVHGGLTGNDFPLTAGCDEGMNWFKNRKQWKYGAAYGGDYIPKKGDVVYYSSSNNQNDSTHVGWVESCDGTLMTAVEGNYSNKVGKRTIYLTNPYILGYGIINYPDENGTPVLGTPNKLAGTGIGTAVALETMNVRSGPGTSYERIGNIAKGKSVEVVAATENNWLKVVWDTAESGYAYVSNTKPYFSVTWKENSYKENNDSYQVGTVIQFKGTKHYVSADATKEKTCIPGKAKITQIAKGTKHPYHLIATDGGGSNVYGWVDAEDVAPLAQSDYVVWVGEVTASVLNVRTGPGTKHGKLQAWPQLGKGNMIDVLGEVKADDGSTWYYVNIQGNKGYVHSAYIKKV